MLPEFNIKKACVKCGYKGRILDDLVFRPAAVVQFSTGKKGECLLRTCKRCGYQWKEACVDDD